LRHTSQQNIGPEVGDVVANSTFKPAVKQNVEIELK
uniref:MSP domain-containing protein n=1 Tax=Brugia timori TaxID=42155 RepID=A0A0R3QQ16_9BILA